MNLSWLPREYIYSINNLLSNNEQFSPFPNITWNEGMKISDEKIRVIFKEFFDGDIEAVPSEKDELKILQIFLSYLPVLDRKKSDTLRKYSNANICTWDKFVIGRFNIENLNDLNETKWFSSIFDGSGFGDITKMVKKETLKSTTYATFTTQSSQNEHYMCSNYSHDKRHWVEYDKSKVFYEFDKYCLRGSRFGLRGFVRYGSNKVDLINIYNELKRLFPSSRALKFGLLIMCFFVKGVCMKEEEEYRFLVLNNRSRNATIDLDVFPQKFRRIKDEELIWNHFYPNKHLMDKTQCGCVDGAWNRESSKEEICTKK